jgi:transglutaminase-like putative cysteine protease
MQFPTFLTSKRLFLAGLLVALVVQFQGVAQGGAQEPEEVLSRANQLELKGQFKQAAQLLSNALGEKSLSNAQRKQLEFDLDRLERIKKDFPYTREGLFEELKKTVKSLTTEEYEQWIREGRFDSREFDGEQRFMVSSVSNLFFRYPELSSRRQPPKDNSDIQRHYWELSAEIKKAALAQKKPYVLPRRFHATMTVTAHAGAAPAGEIVRAWLPIPRQYPFQNEFELVSASPSAISIDRPDSSIRSVYLEQRAATNQPSEFKVEYEYTRYGIWFDLKPESVRTWDTNDTGLTAFVKEGPHVVFTPEMRALSRQIVGDETNPCRQAKRIYDWVAEHIQYSYAIEYSTIRNIGDYCRSKGYGDCGQEALLFITLCRLNGIPARWESGWNIFPHFKDIHDWTEIYLAPYGWVPVDPYMGIFAMRLGTALSPEQRRELRDFYFGGLEQYRMAANSDHSQTLSPPKQSFRSDNVDFQRGELECGAHNIYFDQYSYDLRIAEVNAASP